MASIKESYLMTQPISIWLKSPERMTGKMGIKVVTPVYHSEPDFLIRRWQQVGQTCKSVKRFSTPGDNHLVIPMIRHTQPGPTYGENTL